MTLDTLQLLMLMCVYIVSHPHTSQVIGNFASLEEDREALPAGNCKSFVHVFGAGGNGCCDVMLCYIRCSRNFFGVVCSSGGCGNYL
jgi:hypothetical protein